MIVQWMNDCTALASSKNMALHRLPCLLHHNVASLVCRAFCDLRACVISLGLNNRHDGMVQIVDVDGYKELLHCEEHTHQHMHQHAS